MEERQNCFSSLVALNPRRVNNPPYDHSAARRYSIWRKLHYRDLLWISSIFLYNKSTTIAATASGLVNNTSARVDALVLFTSPTTLYVVPVTCNNNTPILHHGWRILWTHLLNLYSELSQCCTKQKLRMPVNLRILCPTGAPVRSRCLHTNVPVVNSTNHIAGSDAIVK